MKNLTSPPFDHAIICPHCGAVMKYNQVSEGRLRLVKRMSPDLSMTNLRAKCGRGFYECPRGCMFKWVSEIKMEMDKLPDHLEIYTSIKRMMSRKHCKCEPPLKLITKEPEYHFGGD